MSTDVDLLVVGGGIAGAGVALEAARRGVRVMLVEARDFAWGSSSRSSKLVHGGLRYLREGAFGLTRESVRERGRLLHDAPGLVEPQRFLIGHYEGRSPGRREMGLGLAIYDAMAGRRTRAFHTPAQVRELAPHVAGDGLLGASAYLDAKTDDARLVMRVLQEAQRHGARVVNRAAVRSLLRVGDADVPPEASGPRHGTVVGARIEGDGFTGHVRARCVVNATGFWADGLRRGLGAAMLRPLRGSHLVLPLWRLPLGQSVSLMHPRDGRPVFATPWEGMALVGTTDLDHDDDPDVEPRITAAETAYLVEALRHAFPRLDLRASDAVCSFSGVRPVVDDRAAGADPSKAPREHVVRDEQGLVTLTGGKLTTFRVNALDALRHAAPYLQGAARRDFDYRPADPILAPQAPPPEAAALPFGLRSRLLGRHGPQAAALLREAAPADLEAVPGTTTPWAELHWALRHEQVRFLDDLLLRRTRLGLLLSGGAAALLPRLEPVAREALGWGAGEWRDQCDRYVRLIAPVLLGTHAMTDDLILSIDCGTQSARALLFDVRGELVAKSQVALDDYVVEQPGWMTHDVDGFWAACARACRQLWRERPELAAAVRAVTVTTQRGTIVPIAADGRAALPALVWLDQRRATQVPRINAAWRAAFRLAGVGDTVRYFQREAEVNWWAQHEPAAWARTHKVLLLSGLLNWKLTGEFVDSVGAQVGYVPFDFKAHAWARPSDWKWQALAVRPEQLPELRPVGSLLGHVSPEASTATGIAAGTPVIAAAADKACEVLGSGCLEPHQGGVSYGTTATINVCTTKYAEALSFVPPYPAALPGHYDSEVQIFRGYWMVRWFKEQFGDRELAEAQARGVAPEALLDELVAAVPPGSLGLVLQPYWTPGIRHPGPDAKGAIIGFGDAHTRAHVYRAILEGLGYALRDGRERIERKTGVALTELRVSGGGSQSDAALQLTADIFRLPASRPHVHETSGLGAAIAGAVGLGLHPDFATAAREMTRVARTFEPDARNASLYDELYGQVYQKMYARLAPLYARIRTITGYPARD